MMCWTARCAPAKRWAHGAQHLVLIDSISPRRAPTAGRAVEAEQMDTPNGTPTATGSHIAKMGTEDYGLTVGMHAHAAVSWTLSRNWSVLLKK